MYEEGGKRKRCAKCGREFGVCETRVEVRTKRHSWGDHGNGTDADLFLCVPCAQEAMAELATDRGIRGVLGLYFGAIDNG